MSLGACRLNFDGMKAALLPALLLVGGFPLVSCAGGGPTIARPPSGVTTRVLASQSVSSATAFPGLVIVDGQIDTLVRGGISAGNSPGLMAISPDRKTLLVFNSAVNNSVVEVIHTATESQVGAILLPGPTTSMVALDTGFGYAAVPSAPFETGPSPGAVEVMNLTAGGLTATISIPNAQTLVSSPDGTKLLVFNNSNTVTIMSQLLVNTGNPVTVTVPGFDMPVYGVFSADGGTAYILNCGAQCGGTQASVQILNMTTTPPTVGAVIPVNGATIGFLSGSTLYVAGKGTPTGPLCASIPSAAPTAATYCGTLDLVDLTTMQDPYFNNPAAEIAITDGYHDRIDMSVNGQLFIGSNGCTNIGDVNNVQGEVRGCLSIFNTADGAVVIPPDNGDVTGLQRFTTRDVEYVVEGGNLRVYDTLIDKLLPPNSFIETGTIIITGYIIDVKAIDFF
jgi:DNA-binding beta-propeller fold protein YncE